LFEIAKFLAAIALPIVHSINILISSLVLPLVWPSPPPPPGKPVELQITIAYFLQHSKLYKWPLYFFKYTKLQN